MSEILIKVSKNTESIKHFEKKDFSLNTQNDEKLNAKISAKDYFDYKAVLYKLIEIITKLPFIFLYKLTKSNIMSFVFLNYIMQDNTYFTKT